MLVRETNTVTVLSLSTWKGRIEFSHRRKRARERGTQPERGLEKEGRPKDLAACLCLHLCFFFCVCYIVFDPQGLVKSSAFRRNIIWLAQISSLVHHRVLTHSSFLRKFRRTSLARQIFSQEGQKIATLASKCANSQINIIGTTQILKRYFRCTHARMEDQAR